MEHIDSIAAAQGNVLRANGNDKPIDAYKKEASKCSNAKINGIKEVARRPFRRGIEAPEEGLERRRVAKISEGAGRGQEEGAVKRGRKIGRTNQPLRQRQKIQALPRQRQGVGGFDRLPIENRLLTLSYLLLPVMTHLFTTRHGGVSSGVYESFNLGLNRGDEAENVRENYRRLAGMIGCGRFVFANQMHTDLILRAGPQHVKGDVFDPVDYVADGLVTREKNIALVVFAADCVPIARGRGGHSGGPRGLARRNGGGHSRRGGPQMDCAPGSVRAI
jgi:hypothetical protein